MKEQREKGSRDCDMVTEKDCLRVILKGRQKVRQPHSRKLKEK